LDRKPTFVCRAPHLDDLLPLELDAPEHKIGQSTASGIQISAVTFNGSYNPEYWIYAQGAQATYLLHIVIEHIFDTTLDNEAKESKAAKIDQELQAFLLSMMHQPKEENLDVCGPYSIIMR
jgi:hypothetical protein